MMGHVGFGVVVQGIRLLVEAGQQFGIARSSVECG
jgi:hypothetical protein